MNTLSLSIVARIVREEILEVVALPESCIETTRALIEVLRYLGVAARPLPVRVMVCNAEAADCIRTKTPRGEWPPSAYALRIKNAGEEPAPGRWNGHLVAVANGCLIDASLDQFSRPARGIVLEVGSGVFRLPADWNDEELILDRPDGMVIYGLIADHAYRLAPAWREYRAEMRTVAASAIRRLRAQGENVVGTDRLTV